MNTKFYEEWAIAGKVDPQDLNNASLDSTVVDMSLYSEVAIVVMTGALNASATDTITVKDSPDASTYSSISGKTLAITGSSPNQSNMEWIICVRSDEMNAGARYLKATQVNSANSQLMSIIIFGKPLYGPGTMKSIGQTPIG